jgi:predicted benzoate:H+ symporter BenE
MTTIATVIVIVAMAAMVTIVPTRPVVSICMTGVAAVIVAPVGGSIISIGAIWIAIIITMMVAVDSAQYQGRRDTRADPPTPSAACLCAIC